MLPARSDLMTRSSNSANETLCMYVDPDLVQKEHSQTQKGPPFSEKVGRSLEGPTEVHVPNPPAVSVSGAPSRSAGPVRWVRRSSERFRHSYARKSLALDMISGTNVHVQTNFVQPHVQMAPYVVQRDVLIRVHSIRYIVGCRFKSVHIGPVSDHHHRWGKGVPYTSRYGIITIQCCEGGVGGDHSDFSSTALLGKIADVEFWRGFSRRQRT